MSAVFYQEKKLTQELAASRRLRRVQSIAGISFSLPAFILMLMLLLIPVLVMLIMSFSDWQLGSKHFNWVGLRNYIDLFKENEVFRRSLYNTFYYSFVVVLFSGIFGLVLALMITSVSKFTQFYRMVFFLPVMATFVAMVIVWEYMLHPDFGIINNFITSLGLPRVNFLRNEHLSLLSIAVIGIWKQSGFNMVIFMAGLSGINKELYHAANVDGAVTFWDRFRLVTWPQLGSVTIFVVTISLVYSFQAFDAIHVLTQGGPNHSSEVLIYTMYEEGFIFFRTGYASAVAVTFLIIVTTIITLKNKFLEKKVHYES